MGVWSRLTAAPSPVIDQPIGFKFSLFLLLEKIKLRKWLPIWKRLVSCSWEHLRTDLEASRPAVFDAFPIRTHPLTVGGVKVGGKGFLWEHSHRFGVHMYVRALVGSKLQSFKTSPMNYL